MNRKQIFSVDISPEQREALFNIFPSIFNEKNIDKENFKILFESNTPPKILYHYTSVNTLQSILKGIEDQEKNISTNISNCFVLRGSHIEYLNDITEFKIAAKLMARLIKKYEESLDEANNKHIAGKLDENYWKKLATFFGFSTSPFITSFSENSDSLPMWNTYGHEGKGVAIGIKKIELTNSTYKSKTGKPTWIKCAYDSERLKDILSQAIKELYKMFEFKEGRMVVNGLPNFNTLSAYFCILKNFAFEYEKEWRLVRSYSSHDVEKEIKFQEINGLLRPYVEHRFPKTILKEIIIGPCSNLDILKKSIEMSLERAGYCVTEHIDNQNNSVLVKPSTIPFRHI